MARGGQAHNFSHPFGPDSLFAVDKSTQTLFYFSKNKDSKQLALVRTIPCTTGKVRGDKFREGDLKTPEGIYFIQGKKDRGLNFSLYGDLAFVLNFPNPVDQAKGKTGHGIWMHGRGKPIQPHETKGCVALNNSDIRSLKMDVRVKTTPVVISDAISWNTPPGQNDPTSNQLISLTEHWANAWDEKSPRFFTYYNTEYFSNGFTQRKKRLFERYAWIDVVIDNVRCIEGPEYCVTYFDQLYNAPGFSSEGVKRLYWKKTPQGGWKIIGSEWFEAPTDLHKKYVHKLSTELSTWLEKWRKSWEQGDVQEYASFYTPHAIQGKIRGRSAIAEHKEELVQQGKAPQEILLGTPGISNRGRNTVQVSFLQDYVSVSGYKDKGMKTLTLIRMGEQEWRITREIWKRMDE
ncbi:L,D-transpeptidase family protein [Desulfoplanes sp.]